MTDIERYSGMAAITNRRLSVYLLTIWWGNTTSIIPELKMVDEEK